MSATRACFGIVGPFDVDSLAVQVTWRVVRSELGRRRPDVTVRSFAPFGSTRPIPIAADEPAEPLMPDTVARRDALAAELVAIVHLAQPFAPDALAALYDDHPPVDPHDRAHAVQLLVDPAAAFGAPIATLADDPHPALLARRWFSYATCQQRRELLRALQWWPQRGAAIVVRGDARDVERADAVARALPARGEIVVLEAEPHDHAFAAALESRLGARALRMPAERSGLEDRLAAIAGATLVVHSSASPGVAALARAYHRPFQSLDELLGGAAPHDDDACATSAEAELDDALDALARLDGGAARPVTADAEVAALRVALDAQARRTAHERVVLADYVRAVRAVTGDQVRDLEAALRRRLTTRVWNRLHRDRDPS